MPSPQGVHRLVQKLESITDLTEAERQGLLSLPLRVQEVRADQDITREGDRPTQSFLLLEGFICRYKLTQVGKRQIFAFHTPGDIPDLLTLHLKTLDHNVGTVTACTVGFIQHEHLHELLRQQPRLMDVFWRDTLVDGAIFREWMLGIGRRSARTRIAHLFCEMTTRLRAVDLVDGNRVPLPITQAELGDALGLSTVHVNRSVQELRGDNLIEWQGGVLTVLDWESLKAAGEFDPTYLHLSGSHTVP
ncbi:Crp/Fnr family transcriptional regulator [Salinarimonas soli]|uniref:Crp/Fnr family transcriptional regulator n=2 Tax=Salinarimonas soli TaxID=1638099 RepID=A0A5B2VBZ6_9HYPH|nr:Crp/Fnr family transcriptional regulator [Salinarimonas soli]